MKVIPPSVVSSFLFPVLLSSFRWVPTPTSPSAIPESSFTESSLQLVFIKHRSLLGTLFVVGVCVCRCTNSNISDFCAGSRGQVSNNKPHSPGPTEVSQTALVSFHSGFNNVGQHFFFLFLLHHGSISDQPYSSACLCLAHRVPLDSAQAKSI